MFGVFHSPFVLKFPQSRKCYLLIALRLLTRYLGLCRLFSVLYLENGIFLLGYRRGGIPNRFSKRMFVTATYFVFVYSLSFWGSFVSCRFNKCIVMIQRICWKLWVVLRHEVSHVWCGKTWTRLLYWITLVKDKDINSPARWFR